MLCSVTWIGLTHGSGWLEIFQFLVGWVHYSKSTKDEEGGAAYRGGSMVGGGDSPPRKTARKISPTISFIPDLKPSFSANPSHRSLSFSSSGLTTWIPQTFTVTTEHIRFSFLVVLAVLHFLPRDAVIRRTCMALCL